MMGRRLRAHAAQRSDLRVSRPNLPAAVVCASLQCAVERAVDALHCRWIDAEPLGNDPYAGPPWSCQSLTDSFLQLSGVSVGHRIS